MEEEQNLIERFFDNELNEEELRDFHRKLEEDPEFAQAFELEKDVLESIESLGNDQLRQELQQIHREEVPQSSSAKSRSLKPNRRWWIAAAILFGLALAWWLWPKASPQPHQLYAQYARHDFSFVEKSGGTDEEKQLLFSAESALTAGDYQQALVALNQYLQKQPQDREALLAKGIALLELGDNTAPAKVIFQSLIDSNSLLVHDGRWFMALAHLKEGEMQDCQLILEQIPETSVRFSKAQALLEQIRN